MKISKGASAVEYFILVAMVAAFIVGAFVFFKAPIPTAKTNVPQQEQTVNK